MSGAESPEGPTESHPWQALGVSAVAGLATVLGVLAIPLLRRFEEKSMTAASLAFASGVMLWVSFMDVMKEEAEEKWEDGNCFPDAKYDKETKEAWIRAWMALFFFTGILIAVGMDVLVDYFSGHGEKDEKSDKLIKEVEMTKKGKSRDGDDEEKAKRKGKDKDDDVVGLRSSAADSPKKGISGRRRSMISVSSKKSSSSSMERVSLIAFLALTAHNFPEGMVTYFSGEQFKMTVPIAIGLHNIPEGAAVAIPIYQSTGSFTTAFTRTLISGLAQPVGGLVGMLISGAISDEKRWWFSGAMFSMTAGIMVCVSVMELMPEALEAGKSTFFVSMWLFAGFIVMEISIIVMEYCG